MELSPRALKENTNCPNYPRLKRSADRSCDKAGRNYSLRAERGDRGGRIVAARPSPDLGRTRLFPAFVSGLRSRGRAMPHARLPRHRETLYSERALDLLVPELSEVGFRYHADLRRTRTLCPPHRPARSRRTGAGRAQGC